MRFFCIPGVIHAASPPGADGKRMFFIETFIGTAPLILNVYDGSRPA